MNRNKKLIALGAGVVVTAGIVAGCESPQLNDLRNSPTNYPNYSMTYINVSGFPNVTELCINGLAFYTTTRDYNAIARVPQWDAFCATQIGKEATVNGQP